MGFPMGIDEAVTTCEYQRSWLRDAWADFWMILGGENGGEAWKTVSLMMVNDGYQWLIYG